MLRVGLTGGIGSGKSTVARIFQVLGVPVFHADEEARRLLDTDPGVRRAVAERFGADLYASGTLDRRALAARVFNDAAELAALNAIAHPAVRAAFAVWSEQQRAPYVVMEAAILAETGGHAAFDRIVVVEAPEALRVQRTMARDGVGEEDVRARMRRQAGDAERRAIAHHRVINDDEQLVIPQVLGIHRKLIESTNG